MQISLIQTLILGVLLVLGRFAIHYWQPAVIRERTKRKIVLWEMRGKIDMKHAEQLSKLVEPEQLTKAPVSRPWWKWWPP